MQAPKRLVKPQRLKVLAVCGLKITIRPIAIRKLQAKVLDKLLIVL
nr:MAG TPA: hypothetical protein [Caudoviricetes sp.]